MELQRTNSFDVDITSEASVLSYTYTGANPLEVMARVDLGDASKPIQGGAQYTLNFYINGVLVTPVSTVQVPAGSVRTIMVSRQVPIDAGDVVVIKVLGIAGDTAVDTVATLRSATPLQSSDIFGTGSISVDHDYGGTNALTYVTPQGAGIADASIIAYRTADYNVGNRSNSFVVGRTHTVSGGVWAHPIMLSPDTYTLIYYAAGLYGPDRRDVVVSQ